MVSDDSSTTSGRHTARKQAARELAGRTGMKYTEALRHVSDTGAQRTSRWRWVLTDEVRRFFAGDGWRNVQIENLYDWLDGLDPGSGEETARIERQAGCRCSRSPARMSEILCTLAAWIAHDGCGSCVRRIRIGGRDHRRNTLSSRSGGRVGVPAGRGYRDTLARPAWDPACRTSEKGDDVVNGLAGGRELALIDLNSSSSNIEPASPHSIEGTASAQPRMTTASEVVESTYARTIGLMTAMQHPVIGMSARLAA